MTTTIIAAFLDSQSPPPGLDLVEKYGILGLLWMVLAAVGYFLVQKGGRLVEVIGELNTNIKVLITQHEASAAAQRIQIDANTKAIIDMVKEGLRDVREEFRNGGNGGGKE